MTVYYGRRSVAAVYLILALTTHVDRSVNGWPTVKEALRAAGLQARVARRSMLTLRRRQSTICGRHNGGGRRAGNKRRHSNIITTEEAARARRAAEQPNDDAVVVGRLRHNEITSQRDAVPHTATATYSLSRSFSPWTQPTPFSSIPRLRRRQNFYLRTVDVGHERRRQ